MKDNQANIKIGFLGGGQLARLLCIEAHSIGLTPYIYCENPDDPAAQVCSNIILGSLKNKHKLEKFFKTIDICTFESEFVDTKLVSSINSKYKKKINPTPKLINQIQDRLSQKKLITKHGIPTAHFVSVKTIKSAKNAVKELGYPLVFKKRLFGYDGYGTFVVKNENELKKFLEQFDSDIGYIAEEFVPFEKEIAFMIGRQKSGKTKSLPWVETFQKDSRCFWVKGPIKNNLFKNFEKKVKIFLEEIKYEGIICFELFLYKNKLIVNELAPRVHNSGHHSLNSIQENQFLIHLKSILNIPYNTEIKNQSGFAMVNLLGANSKINHWKNSSDTYLHWYGKKISREGRKMGHINVIAKTPALALKKGLKALKEFKV